jgi:hypothetical protein
MSSFNQPRQCNKECGSIIYFDRNSLVGHPKENVWLPLEYKEGRKTDTLHNCPRKNHNGTLTNNGNGNPVIKIITETKEDPALEALTLEFKTLLQHITEYLRVAKN